MIAVLLLASACRTIPGPSLSLQEALAVRVAPTRYDLTVRIDFAQQSLDGTARITLR